MNLVFCISFWPDTYTTWFSKDAMDLSFFPFLELKIESFKKQEKILGSGDSVCFMLYIFLTNGKFLRGKKVH